MIKKTITHTDFNGDTHTEDFYFNVTKAEIIEMEYSGENNSFTDYINRIIKAEKGGEIIKAFREFIGACYGVRSEDGKSFVKTQAARDLFLGSDAYSELFMELLQDENKSVSFVRGVFPEGLDITKDLKSQIDTGDLEEPEKPTVVDMDKPKEPKDMTREELMAAFAAKNQTRLGQ